MSTSFFFFEELFRKFHCFTSSAVVKVSSTKVEIFVGSNNIRVGYLLVVVDPTLFLKSEFQLGNIYTCKRACSLPVSFSCHASPSKKGKTIEIKRYAFT